MREDRNRRESGLREDRSGVREDGNRRDRSRRERVEWEKTEIGQTEEKVVQAHQAVMRKVTTYTR